MPKTAGLNGTGQNMPLKSKFIRATSKHTTAFPRFVTVGISSTILTLGPLYIFKEYLGIYYVLSGLMSGQISIIWAFVWHDNWTWKDRRKGRPLLARLVAFEGIYIFTNFANSLLLYAFTEYLLLPYLHPMLLAIGITFLFNYFMHSKITFKGV
ncbi:MAG: GtrA family protein [Candidatus Micrarchaeota archaeon]